MNNSLQFELHGLYFETVLKRFRTLFHLPRNNRILPAAHEGDSSRPPVHGLYPKGGMLEIRAILGKVQEMNEALVADILIDIDTEALPIELVRC